LTARLVLDHKTIADFRKDNGPAIHKVCARFVILCQGYEFFPERCATGLSTSLSPRLQPIDQCVGYSAVCDRVNDMHPLGTRVVCKRAKHYGITFGRHIEITQKSGTQLAHTGAELEIRTPTPIVGLFIF
jgi:hypothetical protein